MSYAGSIAPVEIPGPKIWDPRSGWQNSRRWRGEPTLIALLADQAKAAGARVELNPDESGAYSTVTVVYGVDGTQPPEVPLVDQWSLQGNDLEKDLWTKPEIKTQLDRVTGEDSYHKVGKLRRLIEAVGSGEEEEVPNPATTDAVVVPTIQAVRDACAALGSLDPLPFIAYIKSRMAGVEVFTVSQWVLSHVLIIAANSTIRPSLVNVGRVYTTEMLRAVEAIPATIKFDLASGWWLKRTPTVEQTAADKWTITQEYWHTDTFDPFVYAIAQ